MSMMIHCYRAADQIISDVKAANGVDYSSKREEIANLFNDELYDGNYSATTDFGGDLPDLYLIQEDEYDQTMEEDEDRPDFDSQITYSAGHYVFPG
jgi:hypothetical protein